MSRIEVLRAHSAPAAPRAKVRGDATGRLLRPDDYSLWCCHWQLGNGAELVWDDAHPEEAIYVASGALEVEGRVCPSGGAVVVEAGVSTRARTTGPCEIVHFGPSDLTPPRGGAYGPPSVDGHGVHVVGPGGRFTSGSRDGTFARWYADSTCPTCRLCLIQVERAQARDGPPHHHSQDEIIFVTGGAIAIGADWLGPGTALFIPAGARYRVRTGETGYRFLNYRRDVSEQVYAPGEPPQLESALARGGVEVGDVL